jgi:tRNA-specific 2-thiouridylase
MKAVALLSGGLDSLLAMKLVEDQGMEVVPLHMVTPFTGRLDPSFPEELEEGYGVKGCRLVDIREAFLSLLRNPPHGFGKYLNPCIDCKILFLKKAREIMGEEGASFVITGEVVGQRPMSQRKEILSVIEKASGMEDLVLRPLSARLLPPSLPEREGWVDRDRLEAIGGRSRKRQLELAQAFGWRNPPSPAGGCLLTDPAFSRKLKDLLDHLPPGILPSLRDLELLKVGRHFRLRQDLKLMVGRREEENEVVQSLATPEDVLLVPRGFPGPSGLLVGRLDGGGLVLALSIMARHCKGEGPFTFCYRGKEGGEMEVSPLSPQEVEKWLVI